MAPTPYTHTADLHPVANHPAGGQPTSNHTNTSHMDKWVINLSKTPLTQEQLSLLQKALIMPSPPNTPIEAYIASTEQAANKLPTQEADELRSDVNRLIKKLQQQNNKQCNLNPSQCRALTELKKDNTRVVLTADKGVAMVIMDQQDYINKAQSLLQDTNTYKVLAKDPTSKTNLSPYSKTLNKL